MTPHPAFPACPACGADLPAPFFEVPAVPVHCNVLWATEAEARRAPRGDLRLSRCGRCGLVHNVAFDADRTGYVPGYENSLHGSPRFQDYARNLVDNLVRGRDLRDTGVVEIGCGRGEFLSMIVERRGARGLGFDPSFDGDGPPGVEIVADAYAPATHGPLDADLVCIRHVLEHVVAPADLLADVREGLGLGHPAALYVEVPEATATFGDLAIWDLIYEHCSYFSAPSLELLVTRTGFAVDRSWTDFGGQYLCVEARTVDSGVVPSADPTRTDPLDAAATDFPDRSRAKLQLWDGHLADLVGSGRRVAVWGAGSKGITFLNLLAAGEGVHQVVDVNPRKAGGHVPGTGQAVVTPDQLDHPDLVVVMNANYRDEIARALAARSISAELLVA